MYNIDVRHTINQVVPILKELVQEGKNHFGIYTYGNVGKFIDKEILQKQFGIFSRLIIDNNLFDGKIILNLEQAREQSVDDIVYLICSDNAKFYDEIRDAIYKVLPMNQIIDLFPERPLKAELDDDKLNHTFSVIEG